MGLTKIDDRPGPEPQDALKSPYESPEDKNKDELTEEQITEIEHHLKEVEDKYSALKYPGVVSKTDFFKYVVYFTGCNEEQRAEAIRDLPEHLEKKAEHLKKYTDSVRAHFTNDDGVLNPEGEKILKEYRGMTGEKRKQAAENLDYIIEKRIQEKKHFGELIKESPHFDEDSPHARQLLRAYQDAQGVQKQSLKLRLLKEIQKLEQVEKRCEKLYESANTWYEQGKFDLGERALNVSIKLADRYPNSPRLQVISEWSQRDLRNMLDHIKEQKDIQGVEDEYEELVEVDDFPASLEVAETLVKKTGHFLNFTTNRDGVEVPRKEKYKTAYLQTLNHNARAEYESLLRIQSDIQEQEEDRDSRSADEAFIDEFNTRQGDEFTVTSSAIQEELEQTDQARRTKSENEVIALNTRGNHDINRLTDEKLEDASNPGEKEVVIDLEYNNEERARRLKNVDLDSGEDTAVARRGRLLSTQAQLEDAMNQETQEFTDRFIDKEKAKGDISTQELERFQGAMTRRTESGELGTEFTRWARDPTPGIRLGENYEHDKRKYAEDLTQLTSENTDDEKPGNIINLSQKIQQDRQDHQSQVRRAA